MLDVKMTSYFREQVLQKRSYLTVELCLRILREAEHSEQQADGRWRFWGYADYRPDKAVRVITLEDKETLHNAFLDSGYTRRTR